MEGVVILMNSIQKLRYPLEYTVVLAAVVHGAMSAKGDPSACALLRVGPAARQVHS